MTLKEFIKMVQECAEMVKTAPTVLPDSTYYSPDDGIKCMVCVNENGELSQEETPHRLCFTVPCPSETMTSSGRQQP